MRAMSDRSPGPGDVPMACPFIAFDDDRQRRSTQPDHRHRCYAETPAAPRAISHQEAYCLTGNFPACPTFQDWARREAARSVASEARHEAPAGRGEEALASLAAGGRVGRGPGRPGGPETSPGSGSFGPPASRQLWGSGPEQLSAFEALGAEGDEELATLVRRPPAEDEGGHGRSADGPAASPPLAPPAEDDARGDASESDRLGRPFEAPDDQDEAPAFLARRARGAAAMAAGGAVAAGEVGSAGGVAPDEASSRSSRGTRPPMAARTPPRRPVDADAPSWERPRRFEAYPTLRTRAGVGSVSPVLLGLVALVAAAAILFVLPGLLSKGGLASPTATPTGAPTTSPVASATVAATAGPPTPLVYTVKAGDTLSAIAGRFGVTVDALKTANPQIKDINKIGIGDRITIPTAAPSATASGGASGSVAPSGTSAP